MLAYPSYNVIYLDADYGGFNWIGSTYPGGYDVANSYCTLHGGSSYQSFAGTNYSLTLDVESYKYEYLCACPLG